MTRMVQRLSITTWLVMLVSGNGAAPGAQETKPAQGSSVQRFGMVGLARGQTARLNVVNAQLVRPPDGRGDAGCPVELSFIDSVGRTVASGGGTLRAGEAILIDLPFAERGRGLETRLQIRGVVRSTLGPCADLIATVEIFDTPSGRTTIVLNLPPEPACSDAQEPNDTFEKAYPISPGTIVGSRVCVKDEDFFAITVASEGGAFSAQIDFANAEGDLDLVLYSPTGQQLAKSDGTSNTEVVSYSALDAGVYRLRVFGYFGAAAGYALTLTQ